MPHDALRSLTLNGARAGSFSTVRTQAMPGPWILAVQHAFHGPKACATGAPQMMGGVKIRVRAALSLQDDDIRRRAFAPARRGPTAGGGDAGGVLCGYSHRSAMMQRGHKGVRARQT